MGKEPDGRKAVTVKKILILVEGQTEEKFVKEVLGRERLRSGVFLQPVVLATKRAKWGNKFAGGVSTYGKIRKDIIRLLGDSSAAAVTTFLDYYRLPGDFPGKPSLGAGSCHEKVRKLEESFARDIDDRRFMPFLMLHEFETMLFADIDAVATAFHNTRDCRKKLEAIVAKFPKIEEINDGAATHPSVRIKAIFNDYQKAMHGPLITGRIGMEKIRDACGHFNEWMCRIESLA